LFALQAVHLLAIKQTKKTPKKQLIHENLEAIAPLRNSPTLYSGHGVENCPKSNDSVYSD